MYYHFVKISYGLSLFFLCLIVEMANPSFNLRTLMDSHKLVGNNFISWRRNLRIVLRSERIGFTIEEPYPAAPTEKATEDVWEKYRTSVR